MPSTPTAAQYVRSGELSGLRGISHAFFTRKGGVSGGIYSSLNCGLGSRDEPGRVSENRARAAAALDVAPDRLVTPYQFHSAMVVVAERPWTREIAPRADAVVTATPGLAIAVSTADCVPVLFADADAGVVGAAHAGWRGALGGVVEAAIAAMERLGADRTRIRAAVGPAISAAAYEVGEEFEAQFLTENKANARFFSRRTVGAKPHFDLTGYVGHRLTAAGIKAPDQLGLCTYGEAGDYFSYRRATHKGEPDYGRQISAIVVA